MKKKITFGKIFINIVFVLCVLACVIPFIMLISISFSNEQRVAIEGYSVLPRGVDLTAYKYVFKNPQTIVDAYVITFGESILGTIVSLVIMSLAAYTISRDGYKYKKVITYYFTITMLFGGGLVPTYILITQYLHLGDSFWVYIFPSLVNVWYLFILRTFFKGIPNSLIESAYLDGASEFKIYYKIILPLSKPALATVALFTILVKWNDWNTSLLYINNSRLYTLQYLLQKILTNAQLLKDTIKERPISVATVGNLNTPTETMRMAMAVIAAGPMIFVFPFFQKYFVRGLTVGSIKG